MHNNLLDSTQICVVSDGRAGNDRQALALATALAGGVAPPAVRLRPNTATMIRMREAVRTGDKSTFQKQLDARLGASSDVQADRPVAPPPPPGAESPPPGLPPAAPADPEAGAAPPPEPAPAPPQPEGAP